MSPRWHGDDPGSGDERRRKRRRPPRGRRALADLRADEDAPPTDDLIATLTGRGLITEVLAELKSGKEATAYVVRAQGRPALLKVYRDPEARSFQDDAVYRAGIHVPDERARRAMQGRTRRGRAMLQHGWVTAEYARLWALWRAGLSVPRPLVGPAPTECAETVPGVLMELIGSEDAPAPRLSEAVLTPEEARSAWEQSLDQMAHLLRLGCVHGDYSTYNLLWHHGRVMVIDFPQVSGRENPHFAELLRRDVASLCQSFRRLGLHPDPVRTLHELHRRAARPGPPPREVTR